MKRSGWSVSEANTQRRSRATTFSPKTWRKKNNISDDQLVPNNSPEINFWAFYLVEPCNQDCWSLLVKLVGSVYLTIWVHIDSRGNVAIISKKMALSPLQYREPERGYVKILTRAKTILVPPIEPGRRHQVWRRGPSLKVFVSRIKFNPTKNKKRKPGKSGREEELKKTHCCDCHPISAGFQLNSSSFLSSWIRWTKGKRFTVHCHWSFKKIWLQRFCLHLSE